MNTPGYQISIHSSLVSPILMAGVPRRFAILNGTLAAALTLGLHSWLGIPICLLVHGIGLYLTKCDPYFFDILRRHIKQKGFYQV